MAMVDTCFIGNLSWNTDDQSLMDAFGQFGAVEATVQRHGDSGRSKGWGLVSFQNGTDLQNVIQQMAGFNLDGRDLIVREDRGKTERTEKQPRERRVREPAAPSTSIFFGGLTWSTTTEELQDLVSEFNIVNAEVIMGRNNRSRGYGIVTAQSVEDAEQIIYRFNNTDFNGRTMIVRYDGGN